MKLFKQFGIILGICFIAEIIKALLPDSLPIPAGIYAFILLFLCLVTKIIKLDSVKDAGKYLIEIMPLMFVAPTVGLLESFPSLRPIIIPVIIIILFTTVATMVSTGLTSQAVITLNEKIKNKRKGKDE